MKPITVIIETPKYSAMKFDYDISLQCFKLNKCMPAGMVFPFDFGFIPGTKGEDGDPLDVISIAEFGTFTGCALDCRIIGVIEAEQTEPGEKPVRNDRFIGIAEESVIYKNVSKINDLPEKLMDELQEFFINYNRSAKKKFEVLKISDSTKAGKLIKKASVKKTG